MTEKLLQYLWNYKVFKHFDFKDIEGNSVEILESGKWNTDAGPDFLTGKIKFNNVILAGNIELHVKASDWIFHNHSTDPNYKNIILHVVFYNDISIDDFTINNIPTLELKDYIDENILWKYEKLSGENQFLPCESIFDPKKIPVNFHEENILRKLEEKSLEFEQNLKQYKNDFEAVLFHSLAYSFGLKVNAHIFRQIAESVDFSIVNKIRQNPYQLEALLFGISGWLETDEDEQMKIWKREFTFIKAKFNILDLHFHPKFLRLRPPNFPTIRLSQLASLYHQQQNIFSKVIAAKKTEELFAIFKDSSASEYWDNHFNFRKISSSNYPKVVSKDFINLIILNTILPLKYTYHKYHHEEISEEIISFYRTIAAEKNSVTKKWKNLGTSVPTALESQSLIYHYKSFCEEKNCLHCSIGFKILKESSNV